MTSIESNKTEINAPLEEIYAFLCNFNNFGSLMPPQVSRWQSTADTCSFNIQGMADIDLRLSHKSENECITMQAEERSPFPFTMNWKMNKGNGSCFVSHVIEAELNPMLSMILKAPLQNFVNVLVNKLKELAEAGGLKP